MARGYSTREVKVVRMFCPIEAGTLTAMLAGDPSAIAADPTLSTMLGIIRSEEALGDFDLYKSVVELAPGWELFTPAAAATPTLGEAGSGTTSPTAIVTTYIAGDASPDAIDRALARLVEAHPWEVPVIEINDTVLVTRAT